MVTLSKRATHFNRNICKYKSWFRVLTALAWRAAGQMLCRGGIPTALHLFKCRTHLAAWIIFIQVLFKRHGEMCTCSSSIYHPQSDSRRECKWNPKRRMIKEKHIQYAQHFISYFTATICMAKCCVQRNSRDPDTSVGNQQIKWFLFLPLWQVFYTSVCLSVLCPDEKQPVTWEWSS